MLVQEFIGDSEFIRMTPSEARDVFDGARTLDIGRLRDAVAESNSAERSEFYRRRASGDFHEKMDYLDLEEPVVSVEVTEEGTVWQIRRAIAEAARNETAEEKHAKMIAKAFRLSALYREDYKNVKVGRHLRSV